MSDAEGPAQITAWVREYVAEASREENVEAFVTHVNSAILESLPELDDPVLLGELHASTKAQFQVFLSLLDREKQELLLPPQAVDLALSIARRQLELGVLLKIYRVAAAAVWEFFTAVAASVPSDGPDRTDVLVYLWGHGGTWINEAVEQLIGVFYAEREATMHGALARRSETVHAILRGDRVQVDDVTTMLDHPMRDQQTAVVMWADDPASEALVRLNQAATAVSSAVGASALTVPAGRSEIWLWLAARQPLGREHLGEAFDEFVVDGMGAAVGAWGHGVDGFRESHREAVDAQRYALALEERPAVTFYEEVELPCLVAGNERGARRLVARELGALADADPGIDRIRDTVEAFLARGASVERTAAALFVHKNTIRYRLAQAEEMLGHSLADRRTEIALALQCLRRFGPDR